MGAKEILDRVEQRLALLDISATKASLDAGLSADAIRNLRRSIDTPGRSGMTDRTARLLAPVLRTTVGWLLNGEGEADLFEVQVVGYVGAGDAAHYYASGDGGLDYVSAPDYATASTVAREIRGNSIGHFFDGWLLFHDDLQPGVRPDHIGKLCVVQLPDDRILVKRIQRSAFEGRFHLDSQTEPTMVDMEVVASAKVLGMRPR